MPFLKHACLALGLVLWLGHPGPAAAQEAQPEPSPAFLAAPAMPAGAASTFENWMEYLENWMGPGLPSWLVPSAVIHYQVRKPLYDDGGRALLDRQGRQRCDQIAQSARIFYPPTWRVPTQRRLPLILYTHATTMLKHGVASEFGGHEWMLGAAAALYYGFAVAMPDQPGMGDDAADFHPFCHARSLAYATIDGIPAIQRAFQEVPGLASGGYAWDGRLYVLGYSEGAYTALATVKELETHATEYAAKGNFTLTGSACMAGPFDLSGLTRADMINPLREYDHCFYLPYVIRGYHAVYGQAVDPQEIFAPALLENREDGNIMEWTDGRRNGLAVDDLIGKRLGVPGNRVVFRHLLNPAWVAKELDDPAYETSLIHQLLVENDLHRGWAPTKPILFAQSPVDQDLPFQNTVSAIGYLSAEIAKAGGDPRQILTRRSLGDCRSGVTHLEGAVLAIPLGFDWIYRGMPMDQ